MITREAMEPERGEYVASAVPAQLERIATVLGRIETAIGNASSLSAARADVDRNMAYTEWTAFALDGNPLVESVADCHRLMGRLRGDWTKIEASAELRDWIRRDVADLRERVMHAARVAA